jgi:ferredoxin
MLHKKTEPGKLKVTFITPEQERIDIFVKSGTNLLDAAHGNNIDLEGIHC